MSKRDVHDIFECAAPSRSSRLPPRCARSPRRRSTRWKTSSGDAQTLRRRRRARRAAPSSELDWKTHELLVTYSRNDYAKGILRGIRPNIFRYQYLS
jgi:hypothetical protein